MLSDQIFPMETTTERKPLEIPPNEIWYDKGGRVVRVEHYIDVNRQSLGISTYERSGGSGFTESHFMESHGAGVSNRPTSLEDLPGDVRQIFEVGTREGIRRLRKARRLGNYVDKN